jgi:protein TonB
MKKPSLARRLLSLAATSAAALLAACTSTPVSRGTPPPVAPAEAGLAPASAPPAAPSVVAGPRASGAATPRAYRQDAASHLYGLNRERIFAGRLPPMLYAIGVLEVDVDARGEVRKLHWLRAPRHAPEVITEIERTVRSAAPFPVPVRMGKVTYTDTWLWDRSGRFQLDTLTEGQD